MREIEREIGSPAKKSWDIIYIASNIIVIFIIFASLYGLGWHFYR